MHRLNLPLLLCLLEAIYRQLGCAHDVGLNETRAVEGAKREREGR